MPSLKATATTAVRLARFLAQNPRHSRDLPRWLYARALPGDPAATGNPWLSFKATRFLSRAAPPGSSVFEYGAGGTSVFLARRGVKLYSVEHDAAWFERLMERREKLDLTRNWQLTLELPRDDPSTRFASAIVEGSFEAYARSIERFPDGSFDLVIVDGRARVACVGIAMIKVRVGGHLLLDDYWRPRYAEANQSLSSWQPIELTGLVGYPRSRVFHRSMAWRREPLSRLGSA